MKSLQDNGLEIWFLTGSQSLYGDETLALKISQNFLEEIHVEDELIEQVLFVIKNISFKNRAECLKSLTLFLSNSTYYLN